MVKVSVRAFTYMERRMGMLRVMGRPIPTRMRMGMPMAMRMPMGMPTQRGMRIRMGMQ